MLLKNAVAWLAGIVKQQWISGGATLLTRHLAFFFIPIPVGLMGLIDVFVTLFWIVGIFVEMLKPHRIDLN